MLLARRQQRDGVETLDVAFVRVVSEHSQVESLNVAQIWQQEVAGCFSAQTGIWGLGGGIAEEYTKF